MKKTGLLFLFFLLAEPLLALRIAWDLRVWPQSHQLSPNSLIIVEGYAYGQHTIRELNSKYPVSLKSGSETILLEVVKIYNGMDGKSMALLKPVNNLTAGLTYKLCIDSLEQYEAARLERDSLYFKVSLPADYEKPVWLKSPSYIGNYCRQSEYERNRYTYFCACTDDDSSVLVHTELKDLKSGKIFEYILTLQYNQIRVGAERYFGEFRLIDSSMYEVRFSLMDMCGNTNDSLTNAIQFISPSDRDTVTLNRSGCGCPEKKAKKVFQANVEHNEDELIAFLIPVLVVLGVLIYGLKDYFNLRNKNQ
ncbi:MAG: hypothetical protein IM638_18220 [Bacteroidetes bacterium]|nr:hypothetical protein [Bacteroidota bacterium]